MHGECIRAAEWVHDAMHGGLHNGNGQSRRCCTTVHNVCMRGAQGMDKWRTSSAGLVGTAGPHAPKSGSAQLQSCKTHTGQGRCVFSKAVNTPNVLQSCRTHTVRRVVCLQ